MYHVSHSCDLMQDKVGDACTLYQSDALHVCKSMHNLASCCAGRGKAGCA